MKYISDLLDRYSERKRIMANRKHTTWIKTLHERLEEMPEEYKTVNKLGKTKEKEQWLNLDKK